MSIKDRLKNAFNYIKNADKEEKKMLIVLTALGVFVTGGTAINAVGDYIESKKNEKIIDVEREEKIPTDEQENLTPEEKLKENLEHFIVNDVAVINESLDETQIGKKVSVKKYLEKVENFVYEYVTEVTGKKIDDIVVIKCGTVKGEGMTFAFSGNNPWEEALKNANEKGVQTIDEKGKSNILLCKSGEQIGHAIDTESLSNLVNFNGIDYEELPENELIANIVNTIKSAEQKATNIDEAVIYSKKAVIKIIDGEYEISFGENEEQEENAYFLASSEYNSTLDMKDAEQEH